MKGNQKTYRKLSEIVNDALDDVAAGMHWQYRFTRWGMKYAEELHFDTLRDIRTVLVNFKPWKAIELPDDCVDWCFVGIQNGEDIMTYINDPHTALEFAKDEANELLPNQVPTYFGDHSMNPGNGDYMYPYMNLTPTGEDPGKLFGLRVKYNGLGYFTENSNKDINELQFKGPDIDVTQQVYLTYISNIWDPKEETLIHPMLAEYIVAGILKEYYKHKPGLGFQVSEANAEFDRQYWKVIDRNWDLRVEDVYEYFKYRYQLTPRIP